MSDRYVVAGVIILLLLPLVLNESGGRRHLKFRWPDVFSGDEPHYLVAVNSVVRDGDLDLANNYDSVHRGSCQAGCSLRKNPLGHHVIWYEDGRRIEWSEIFWVDQDRWLESISGVPVPAKLGEATAPSSTEYSWHPPGHALLLAPLLWPVRGSAVWLERAAVLTSGLAIVGAFLLFRTFLADTVLTPSQATLVAALVFLGTPIWHYGRTLFMEPYLTLCGVGAYALQLRYRRFLLAGILIAVGITMKPLIATLLLPLSLSALVDRRVRPLFELVLPSGIAVAFLLGFNHVAFGSPWNFAQPFAIARPLQGTVGLWLDPTHGLLPTAPILLLALVGWPQALRESRQVAWPSLVGFVAYFVVVASWHGWQGGFAYGPRLLVPVLPFLGVGLVGLASNWVRWGRGIRVMAASVVGVSIWLNGWAALHHRGAFGHHPIPQILRQFELL